MSERTTRSRWAAAALLAAALAGAAPGSAQSLTTLKSARQLWDEKPVTVSVEYGAGTLTVLPASKSMLYEMEVRYDPSHFAPVTRFDGEQRRLELGIRSTEKGRNKMNTKEGSRASIALSREVPLDLTLQFGAGDADIDLGGMRLRKLDLSTGASETKLRFSAPNPISAEEVQLRAGAAELTVSGLGNVRADRLSFEGGVGSTTLDFSGEWNRNATATVQMGVGSVTLRLPRDLGVRINRGGSFLSSFDAPGLVKRDGSYFSSNWDRAAHQLTVDIDAAFGSIDIEWIG
jgi:hypothetical protein